MTTTRSEFRAWCLQLCFLLQHLLSRAAACSPGVQGRARETPPCLPGPAGRRRRRRPAGREEEEEEEDQRDEFDGDVEMSPSTVHAEHLGGHQSSHSASRQKSSREKQCDASEVSMERKWRTWRERARQCLPLFLRSVFSEKRRRCSRQNEKARHFFRFSKRREGEFPIPSRSLFNSLSLSRNKNGGQPRLRPQEAPLPPGGLPSGNSARLLLLLLRRLDPSRRDRRARRCGQGAPPSPQARPGQQEAPAVVHGRAEHLAVSGRRAQARAGEEGEGRKGVGQGICHQRRRRRRRRRRQGRCRRRWRSGRSGRSGLAAARSPPAPPSGRRRERVPGGCARRRVGEVCLLDVCSGEIFEFPQLFFL